jgi:hypothetical protein
LKTDAPIIPKKARRAGSVSHKQQSITTVPKRHDCQLTKALPVGWCSVTGRHDGWRHTGPLAWIDAVILAQFGKQFAMVFCHLQLFEKGFRRHRKNSAGLVAP